MKLIVLTPIYATETSKQGATPVVHYFAKEWVKAGHQVSVFHLTAKYPRLLYWVCKVFQHRLNTLLGSVVPVNSPTDDDYQTDGVVVHRRCMRKVIPHSLYSKRQLRYAIGIIEKDCKQNGIPDWFIGHWDNPQLELLSELKKLFNKPVCLVLHDNVFSYETKYGESFPKLVAQIDVLGFRSFVSRFNFESKYGKQKQTFVASSGVSQVFLDEGSKLMKVFSQPIHNFVFVGALIGRKYPVSVLMALSTAFPNGDFSITFIGDGAERKAIETEHLRNGCKGQVVFTGQIPRGEIIKYLRQSDVFVMISKDEIFGLVYLEAMALGLISIGSKNEGIDGIIHDGENGFLCQAGNVVELSQVIGRIRSMTVEQLRAMSDKAKETAQGYSDREVAINYLKALSV